MVLLIAPRTCESTSTQVRVAAALKCGLYNSSGSLGDVHNLSIIYMKVCELFFVDIGVHRTRLIAISVLRWVDPHKIVFINHMQVRSLLVILIAFQAREVLF